GYPAGPMTGSRFVIHPGVFGVLPGMRVAIVVAIGVGEPTADVGPELTAAWTLAAAAAAPFGNAQSHPRGAPRRSAFRAMGAPPATIRARSRRCSAAP